MTSAEVDRERMRRRACESFLTVTELADTLVREEDISFYQAHHLVAAAVRAAGRDCSPERLVTEMEGIAPKILGREIRKRREMWLRALDPAYFIAVRKIPGGPAPEVVRAQIAIARKEQAETKEWLDAKRSLLDSNPQLIQQDIAILNNTTR
jgi:argininosuccinate lyase